MKVKLLDWAAHSDFSNLKQGDKYLLKLGNADLSEIALELDRLTVKPFGVVPPFDSHNLSYTARCMATVRDHFSQFPTYAPVPKWCPREFIRSARGAGFDHFAIPYQEPWLSFYQVFHDLVEGKAVHVAGGELEREGWTWSEEGL